MNKNFIKLYLERVHNRSSTLFHLIFPIALSDAYAKYGLCEVIFSSLYYITCKDWE